MCGIAGALHLGKGRIEGLKEHLDLMSTLIRHRGPDGQGVWENRQKFVGLAHRRLAIIDLTDAAHQPMQSENGTCLSFNGEIYNYKELQRQLCGDWTFRTNSDTECILASYARFGTGSVSHLRGMFAFALWDERMQRLFCVRDRFGIKPFYYTVWNGVFYFASEAKALLPFVENLEVDKGALAEYLTFQYTIGEKTLFRGIKQLLPGHSLVIENGEITTQRYWDVEYEVDFGRSEPSFHEELRARLDDSMNLHLRSDVEIGSYLSGGVDSSLIYSLAVEKGSGKKAFHGRFLEYPGYDESQYAEAAVESKNGDLRYSNIRSEDFLKNIERIIYHLDFPVAGPGSFPQYMTSELAASSVKVVLGGQGGDEIFGGYARYLIAYFEQCIKAAIEGRYLNGNFVVTLESIVPNLGLLREYKPLMKKFWSEGLFEPMDHRYFRLIDRSTDFESEIYWEELDRGAVFEDFCRIFNNRSNVRKEAYFDKMTHFDFKCLIPALLQVEDRMSMAHGIESRVPLLDHPLIEFAATIPADIKFKDGRMKHLMKQVYAKQLPKAIMQRRDKMGFPVPLKEWFEGDLKEFAYDTLKSMSIKHRPFVNSDSLKSDARNEARFSRKTWALLSLELWYQQFIDQSSYWKSLRK
ncbi:MAG: asparagine synthase (glutamine-hydrolyzing) [Opitutales bacterium]